MGMAVNRSYDLYNEVPAERGWHQAKGLTGKHTCGTMEAPYEGKEQPLGRAAPNAVCFCDRSDTVRPAQGRGSTGKM